MSRIEFAGAVSFEADADDYRFQSPVPAPTLPQRRLRQALAELGPVRPLPPPTRPSRPAPTEAVADLTGMSAGQGETISDPDEIVRALASAAASLQPEADRQPAAASEADDDTQEYDPPPMMIERELAARAGGFLAEAPSRPSPWPGLAFGFLLSLPVGAVVYYMLVNG